MVLRSIALNYKVSSRVMRKVNDLAPSRMLRGGSLWSKLKSGAKWLYEKAVKPAAKFVGTQVIPRIAKPIAAVGRVGLKTLGTMAKSTGLGSVLPVDYAEKQLGNVLEEGLVKGSQKLAKEAAKIKTGKGLLRGRGSTKAKAKVIMKQVAAAAKPQAKKVARSLAKKILASL